MRNKKGMTRIKLAIIIIGALIIFYFLINIILQIQMYKMESEYEARFHTIYFDTDGGKPIEPIRAQTLLSVSNKRAYKDDIYIFDCWLLDGQPIDSLTSKDLKEDIVLKARYIDPRPTKEEKENAQTIDYVTLFKGENTLRYKLFKITGEIVQEVEDKVYHVTMGTSYENRIEIKIRGEISEILMEGDIISFVGEYVGKTTYYTVLLSENKIPLFKVYAENLKVIGHIN